MVAPGYGYGIVAMAALGYGGPRLWRATIFSFGVTFEFMKKLYGS